MGVVRSTVDFYWRTKMYTQAITVLLQAPKDAYPELSKQFVFEAARKSTDAGQYKQARDLLAELLKLRPTTASIWQRWPTPMRGGAMIEGCGNSIWTKSRSSAPPFSGEDRKTRIATLRRGLIPALTRMKEYAARSINTSNSSIIFPRR